MTFHPVDSRFLISDPKTYPLRLLAQTYCQNKNTDPDRVELEVFHKWLHNQYFTIPVCTYFVRRSISLDRCKYLFNKFNILVITSEHNEPNEILFTKRENLQFRAVHDYHHIIGNSGSDFAGEYASFLTAANTAPAFIHWILFSEIVLQAAVTINTGNFPPQKIVKFWRVA